MDNPRSGQMCSRLKEKHTIITYGLLALSFILVICLFVTVHSRGYKPESNELAKKDDILGVNLTVNSLKEKMKEIEHAAKKKFTCESGWYLFDRKCYFFTNTNSNWHRARTTCVQKNADLAVINNENEQRFIGGITGNNAYWIGLTDIEAEGNWTWVDGTDYKTSFKFWKPNEPNSYGGKEDCVQLVKEAKWNDRACDDTNNFAVCEKKL
ncbi:hepatic lectin-like isoform 2-T2 [Leptodactylus fuscus]|uniref:hepatic lectin-like isoform X2 n=1 Tax=Leptodactylus fuscus TaxID=238119 RepID=UPI003F4EFA6E